MLNTDTVELYVDHIVSLIPSKTDAELAESIRLMVKGVNSLADIARSRELTVHLDVKDFAPHNERPRPVIGVGVFVEVA